MLSANLSAIFYLISGVLFILALRGLSSPETSRQGNFFGILGMIIAITVTFLSIGNFSTGFVVVLIFLLIGGLIGAFIAYKFRWLQCRVSCGFHSLVGLAAVFVAIAAFLNPEAFNLDHQVTLNKLNRNVNWCSSRRNYFFRFNCCFFKTSRNNVRFPYNF